MLPLKDNLPTERVPLVTLLLIAANVVAYALVDDSALGQLVASVAALWLFGISVEDSMARWRFLALYALGALVAAGLHLLLEPGARVTAIAAVGGVAAVVAAHVALYPRAKVIAIAFLVLFFGLYELPAWLLAAVWAAAQLALALAGAGALDGGAAALTWLGGLAVGAVLVRALVERRKLAPGLAPTTQAVSP